MVKRGYSSFSASSIAKGSIVLSKAIEKQFALEAEISRLRHHVSVLSKRLHSVTLEKQILAAIVDTTMRGEVEGEPLSGEEVADEGEREEVTQSVTEEDATMYVAEKGEKGDEAAPSVAEEDATMSVAEVAEEMRLIVASPLWRRSLSHAWLSLHPRRCQKWQRSTTGSRWTWLKRWNPHRPRY